MKTRSAGPTRVRIFHQLDPEGALTGGVATFIRGLVKAAPADIEVSIVGLTTDAELRPVGRWTTLERDGRRLDFFPVGIDRNPGGRGMVPLSIKMTVGLFRYFGPCSDGCDILEFHRFEPAIPFRADVRPMNAFVHQNMDVIREAKSDILWKHFPQLYFALERRMIPRFASVYCVRTDAAESYRARYPGIADRFQFTPTWMDPDVFHVAHESKKRELRRSLPVSLGFSPADQVLISVGRLDRQKDPLLMVEAFAIINRARPNTRLVLVGDGVLKSAVAARAKALGIGDRVTFAGLRAAAEVSDMFQIADAFLLTSAYEGMPIAVLEALGCGVPVVTTKVGEVALVVGDGINGRIVEEHSPEAFARATLELLSKGDVCRGAPCEASVRSYVPERVLAPIYENYRTLAERRRLPC